MARVALLLMSLAKPAWARGFVLDWTAPAACPQRQAVLDRVASLVPEAVLSRSALSARGRIEATRSGFRLTLESQLGESHGTRTIEATQCEELAGAASVSLGLLLRGADEQEPESTAAPSTAAPSSPPASNTREPSPTQSGAGAPESMAPSTDTNGDRRARISSRPASPSPTAAAAVVRATAPVEDRNAAPEPRAHVSLRWLVLAPAAALELGPIPRAQSGLAAGIGAQWDTWRVALHGQAPFSVRLPIGELSNTQVAVATKHLAVDACYGPRLPLVELWSCVGASVEHVSSRGSGPTVRGASATAIWLAPEIGVVTRWLFWEHAALVLGTFAKLEVGRPKLVIAGLGEVQRWARLGLNLKLGTEWIF